MSAPATLTASHLPGQMLELAGILQSAELQVLDEDGTPINDNVQISFDTEANDVTITVTLPLTAIATSDGISYKATDYLE